MLPVLLSSERIMSAIKNIYVRELCEIGGISTGPGVANTMKTPWNPVQFKALATAKAVPASAIPAPIPGAIPPLAPAPWEDYTNLDYTNIVAVPSSKDKVRMAVINYDLRAPANISILLTNIFNGEYMIHGGKLVFNIPKSSDLLSHFIIPFILRSYGIDITMNTPAGAQPTDAMVAGALMQHLLKTDVLKHASNIQTEMFISTLELSPEEKEAFARYDERVNQIRSAFL